MDAIRGITRVCRQQQVFRGEGEGTTSQIIDSLIKRPIGYENVAVLSDDDISFTTPPEQLSFGKHTKELVLNLPVTLRQKLILPQIRKNLIYEEKQVEEWLIDAHSRRGHFARVTKYPRSLIDKTKNWLIVPERQMRLRHHEEHIELRCSMLLFLPRALFDSKALTYLKLTNGNRGFPVAYNMLAFRSIPNRLGKLKQLETLHIEKQLYLTSLPRGVGQLENLEELKIEFCPSFEHLPKSIKHLSALKTLLLNELCSLEKLPNSFAGLKNLRSLTIRNCEKLQSLPNSILELPSTCHVNITELVLPEAEINRLQALCNARIANDLSVPRINFSRDPRIDFRGFRFNCLRDRVQQATATGPHPIPLAVQTETEKLDTLDRLEIPFKKAFKNLKGLALKVQLQQWGHDSQANKILTAFKNQELSLSLEGIAELPDPIGKLTQLITLSLNNNQLISLPDSISNLQNLTRLDLQNNQFTHIPRVLLNLPAHTEIFLRDNPLSHDEIRAVRAEIQQRRERGLPVPQIILPELPEANHHLFAHRYVINNHQHVRARNNLF